MRRRRFVSLLAMILVLTAIVSNAVTTPPATAISGGDQNTTQHPWLVQVTTSSSSGVFDCTGSLIDRQWVLTAGHCLRGGTTSVSVKLLRDAGTRPDAELEVAAASWSRSNAADVGLVKLSKPYDWNTAKNGPLPRLSRMHDDTTATTYGFGHTTPAGASGTNTSWPKAKSVLLALGRDTPNLGVFASWEGMRNGFYRGTMLTRTVAGSSVLGHTLPGDSGGPLLQYGAIVGVTTTPGILSALKYQAAVRLGLNVSSTAGTSVSSSIAPAYDWILATTGLRDSDLASDEPKDVVSGVTVAFDDLWLASISTKGNTRPARLTSDVSAKSALRLSFDATGAFSIVDGNDKCLQTDSHVIPSESTGFPLFSTTASFATCDRHAQNQRWALRGGAGGAGTQVTYSIANAGTQLYLTSATPTLNLSTAPQNITLSSSTSGFAATLKKYADLRALSPHRVKRDLPETTVSVTFPNGASPTVPPLPSGVKAVDITTATQGNTSFVHALGDDGKLYVTTSQGSSGSAYKPWAVRPQSGIVQMATATNASGTIYTDGVSLYATYGGKFPDLPDSTGMAQIGAAINDQGYGSIYVLGTNGVLYGRPENSEWIVLSRDVEFMTPSEVDSSVAFSVGGRVWFSSPKVGNGAPVALPALPSGSGIADLRLSAQGSDTYAYVLALDGRVYKAGARNANWAAAQWELRPGMNIDGLRTGTVQGGALYTDGTSVYPTYGDKPFTALPAGVTVADIALTVDQAARGHVYVLSTNGDLYRMSPGQTSWAQLNAPSQQVLRISPSQTEGSLAYTATARTR